MKRFWKLWLAAAAVILLITPLALAEEFGAPPETECRHLHEVTYRDEYVHGPQCADCGKMIWTTPHYAVCSALGTCLDCGAPYSGSEVKHDALAWESEENRHRLVCKGCGTVCDDWSPHRALCGDNHVCAACRKEMDFNDSEILHSLTKWMRANAETHHKICLKCGGVMEVGAHTRMCDGNMCIDCVGEYTGGNVQHLPGNDGLCVLCGASSGGDADGSDSFESADGSGSTDSADDTSSAESTDDASSTDSTDDSASFESTDDAGSTGSAEDTPSSGSAGSTAPSGNAGSVPSSAAKPAASRPRAKPAAPIPEAVVVPMPAFYEDGMPRALISAPRTGRVTLRETASADGKALKQFMDGTVVIVLGTSGAYTQVSVNDMTGYVLTGALEMLDMGRRPLGEGVLVYPAKGGSRVSVRSDASIKALKIGAWPTGTEAVVWSVSDNGQWYEIEHENVRVWVHADYLTVTRVYDQTVRAADAAEA